MDISSSTYACDSPMTLLCLQLIITVMFLIGIADYVGVWDFDEFFIPMGKYHTLLNMLDDLDYSTQESQQSILKRLKLSVQNETLSILQSIDQDGDTLMKRSYEQLSKAIGRATETNHSSVDTTIQLISDLTIDNDVNKLLYTQWRGGKGLADKQGHPLCCILLTSFATLNRKKLDKTYDIEKPWIGNGLNLVNISYSNLKQRKDCQFPAFIR